MKRQDCTALPRLADVCGDNIDILAIAISRFVAAGYMTGDVACWDAGHDQAERMLGPIQGSRLVASLTGVIRALRAERAEPWNFMPASCCHLTGQEAGLVRLLAIGRRGDHVGVVKSAASLAGCDPAQRLVAAVLGAAETMNALENMFGSGRLQPAEEIVLH